MVVVQVALAGLVAAAVALWLAVDERLHAERRMVPAPARARARVSASGRGR